MPRHDRSLLEAALVGYEAQHAQLETKIAELRRQLGKGGTKAGGSTLVSGKKRTMSAAARKSISDAQKKRWREYHKAHAAK